MQSDLYSLTTASALFGASPDVIKKGIRAGVLEPTTVDGQRGHGRPYLFRKPGLVAVGLVEVLRRRGAPLSLVRAVGLFLCNCTEEQLQAAADADQLLVATAGGTLPPTFMDRSAVVANDSGFSDLVFAAGIKELWQRLQDGIARHERMLAEAN